MKTKKRKREKENVSWLAGPKGMILAQQARSRAWPAQLGLPVGAARKRCRGRGPTCQRGGGEMALGDETGGSSREGKPVAGARRRFSTDDHVLGGWGGGEARVGGHGGGVKFDR
jgi:hypothetical protein